MVELRKRPYETLEELELALQYWICYYNTERPHQGYRNKDRSPYAVVQEATPVCQDA